MTAEALLLVCVILAVAFVLSILIIYRSGRGPSAISPILEQRLQSLEAATARSDATIREEFGRGRDETRESSRSLREEVTGLFGNLSDALRASLGEKLDTGGANGDNCRLGYGIGHRIAPRCRTPVVPFRGSLGRR